jgi:hypothetical protein
MAHIKVPDNLPGRLPYVGYVGSTAQLLAIEKEYALSSFEAESVRAKASAQTIVRSDDCLSLSFSEPLSDARCISLTRPLAAEWLAPPFLLFLF